MIGLGTQDDFEFAQEFVSGGNLGEGDVTFLWDPSFATWQAFGVRVNSSMALATGDLSSTTEVFFGFDESIQQDILDALPQFS